MSIRFSTIMCGLLALLALTPVYGVASEISEPLHFGSVAMDVPVKLHRRFTPLTQYLSRKLKRQDTIKLSHNMSGAIDDVASGTAELAYLTPVAYIKSPKKGNARFSCSIQ